VLDPFLTVRRAPRLFVKGGMPSARPIRRDGPSAASFVVTVQRAPRGGIPLLPKPGRACDPARLAWRTRSPSARQAPGTPGRFVAEGSCGFVSCRDYGSCTRGGGISGSLATICLARAYWDLHVHCYSRLLIEAGRGPYRPDEDDKLRTGLQHQEKSKCLLHPTQPQ
jgi:hypothetical protein